jgi:exonuclease 3'-5' domain-containing protein 1
LGDNKVLSSRIRFMCKNLLEMRDNEWNARREEEKAKTIAQTHKDTEWEAKQKARIQGGGGAKPGRGGGGGGAGAHKVHQGAEDSPSPVRIDFDLHGSLQDNSTKQMLLLNAWSAAIPRRNTKVRSLNVKVVSSFEDENFMECAASLRQTTLLALDCEGVNLCRYGELSLVQLASNDTCFLFDVFGKSPEDPLILFLKEVIEGKGMTKIVHDCRMDADALAHLLNINLKQCHDTQSWDSVLRTCREKLNTTLLAYGCEEHTLRDVDPVNYEHNPRFWARRPLTPRMIALASGDVKCLLDLHQAQISIISAASLIDTSRSQELLLSCQRDSKKSANTSAKMAKEVKIRQTGKFIGKGGTNLRDLENNGRFNFQS